MEDELFSALALLGGRWRLQLRAGATEMFFGSRRSISCRLGSRHGMWRTESAWTTMATWTMASPGLLEARATAATLVVAARSDLTGWADDVDVDDFSPSLTRAAPMAATVSTWTSTRAERMVAEASTSALV